MMPIRLLTKYSINNLILLKLKIIKITTINKMIPTLEMKNNMLIKIVVIKIKLQEISNLPKH